ncbi:hypothetical protein DMH26_03065 [Streptomyces sp. WAC 05379]|nr:hypothetical protein DMH26_03065 [Streptomyces sp. WAC 05379]
MPQVAPQVSAPQVFNPEPPPRVAPQVNPQVNPEVSPLINPLNTSTPQVPGLGLGQVAAPPVGQLGLPRLG